MRRFKAHQKKRRLATLESKHAAMAADHKTGKARIAFGSKRLFRAQFALEANGYAGIDQWREEWRSARASQFLVLGAKARAVLAGRYAASVEDVRALALPTLQHRLVLNFHAESQGVTARQIIARLLETVKAA